MARSASEIELTLSLDALRDELIAGGIERVLQRDGVPELQGVSLRELHVVYPDAACVTYAHSVCLRHRLTTPEFSGILRGGEIARAIFAVERHGHADAALVEVAPPNEIRSCQSTPARVASSDEAVIATARAFLAARGLLAAPSRTLAESGVSTGLRSFLRTLEEIGEAALLARVWHARIGAEAFAALTSAAVIATVPVCGSPPHAFESGAAISHVAFEQLVADLYRAHPIRTLARGKASMKKLGEQRGGGTARDVFLSYRPWDSALDAALALRERAERRTLLLVPTGNELPTELLARYGPGGRVEVALLEDALDLVEGAVVLNGAGSRERRSPHVQWRTTRGRTIPRPKTWSELRIYKVDGHTVIVEVGKTRVRVTYEDLGMGVRGLGQPQKSWVLLMLVCGGGGQFRMGGQRHAVKMRLSRLRDALQRVFGLEDDPFEDYSPRHKCWRSKFRAYDHKPFDYVA